MHVFTTTGFLPVIALLINNSLHAIILYKMGKRAYEITDDFGTRFVYTQFKG